MNYYLESFFPEFLSSVTLYFKHIYFYIVLSFRSLVHVTQHAQEKVVRSQAAPARMLSRNVAPTVYVARKRKGKLKNLAKMERYI